MDAVAVVGVDIDVGHPHSPVQEIVNRQGRVDYDIELEEGEEHERSLDRDARGLAYALAARHGETRVKQLVEELDPGFTLLRGCNLDEPLYRDVANFVVRHAVPKEAPPSTLLTQADTQGSKMIQAAPEPEPEPVPAAEE